MSNVTRSVIIGFLLLSFFALSEADEDSSSPYFDKTPFKNSTMFILKVNWDTRAKYRLKLANLRSYQRVNQSISANFDVLFKEIERIRWGIGAQYQLPRSISGLSGKFNFMPIYAHMIAYPFLENDFPYIVARIGYNLFLGDNVFRIDYDNDTTLKGGLYYAYGVGTARRLKTGLVLTEIVLSFNKGFIETPEAQFDIKYSRLLFTLGYGF
ncbi:MAG: hypothetical protein GY839_13410 [candidate division Zixibacteria bacterium]|nr:hypothetical protein [candidate division Zixibacteria bacterium]